MTTLERDEKSTQRIILPFCPPMCFKFNNLFKKVNLAPVFVSKNKVKNFICNNKDKIEILNKSGIYSIECSCGYKYVGQSRRAIDVRWVEHNKNIARNEPEKSSVAYHYLEYIDHDLNKNNFKMEKVVSDPYKLNAYETIYMKKNSHRLMNTQPPPIESILFNAL